MQKNRRVKQVVNHPILDLLLLVRAVLHFKLNIERTPANLASIFAVHSLTSDSEPTMRSVFGCLLIGVLALLILNIDAARKKPI